VATKSVRSSGNSLHKSTASILTAKSNKVVLQETSAHTFAKQKVESMSQEPSSLISNPAPSTQSEPAHTAVSSDQRMICSGFRLQVETSLKASTDKAANSSNPFSNPPAASPNTANPCNPCKSSIQWEAALAPASPV
jgi:hypothetical protein